MFECSTVLSASSAAARNEKPTLALNIAITTSIATTITVSKVAVAETALRCPLRSFAENTLSCVLPLFLATELTFSVTYRSRSRSRSTMACRAVVTTSHSDGIQCRREACFSVFANHLSPFVEFGVNVSLWQPSPIYLFETTQFSTDNLPGYFNYFSGTLFFRSRVSPSFTA